MTDYGLKTSRSGYDVKTATPRQLSFSSQYSSLRIHSIITITISCDSELSYKEYIVSSAHGLAYVPVFMATALRNDSPYSDYVVIPVVGLGVVYEVMVWADSTNVNARVYDYGNTQTYTFKIIVFEDKII